MTRLLVVLSALGVAHAQVVPDLTAFAAAVPALRARIAARDWAGFAAAARPFAALQPDLQRREELDDLLLALREIGGVQTPAGDAATCGLLADSFGQLAVADACYQEHLASGRHDVWSARSTFVGYRARLAVARGDLAAALHLLAEQRALLQEEKAESAAELVATVDAHAEAVRRLAAAPDDPWQRLRFARTYWRTAWGPCLQPAHAVRRELERLLAEAAARQDRALLLALRCEQLVEFPSRDGEDDPRAVLAATACVDGDLLAAASKRTDTGDPWTPLLTIGLLLQRSHDAARALVTFDAVVAGAAAVPERAPAVREALVAGAECELERGHGAAATARLDRAEREFPFRSGCGTCDRAEAQRVERLREVARASGR